MQISTELHLPSDTRPFDMLISLKCIANTLFDTLEMQKNLPISLRMACIHRFFISSSSGNLKNPIYSPFGPTRPLSSTPMFLAMPSKPRFGELGSGLNSRPPFMNIKQLLDEVDHDIMNYQNRGLCYLSKPKPEAYNTNTRF